MRNWTLRVGRFELNRDKIYCVLPKERIWYRHFHYSEGTNAPNSRRFFWGDFEFRIYRKHLKWWAKCDPEHKYMPHGQELIDHNRSWNPYRFYFYKES